MKVIHELIAVEVPRGVKEIFIDRMPFEDNLGLWYHSFTYHQVQLPFPCTIIGLASEIKEMQTDDFMKTTTIVFNAAGRDYQSWADLYDELCFTTTPTTDIIFLSKKL